MKKIRCLTNISAVKINDQIINFDVFPNKDKVVEVDDDVAKILLKREGYEEVKERVKAAVKEAVKEVVKEEVQELKQDVKQVVETVIQPKLEKASKNFFTKLWEKLKKVVGGK